MVVAKEGHFRAEKFTQGLVAWVECAGEIIARYFPRQPNDRNELPDSVEPA